jgi:hypothetical protein
MASWEPRSSVLAALPQVGGLESLVLEQWTTAFSGLGKQGECDAFDGVSFGSFAREGWRALSSYTIVARPRM